MPLLTIKATATKIKKVRSLLNAIHQLISDVNKTQIDHLIEALTKYKEELKK
jgi:hypothetical protein